MASKDVRDILLRSMFDLDFHSRLVANPTDVLSEYNLTDDEKRVLQNPSPELYAYLQPSTDTSALLSMRQLGPPSPTPPPVTTTTVITTIFVVAIVVFAIAPDTPDQQSQRNLERLQPLLDAIRSSRGAGRYEMVRALVNELTKGS